MADTPALKPTLWRTCRVLANRTRLRMFRFLVQNPDQNVETVAKRLKVRPPLASEYLRGLEARGFLTARRAASRVYYRVNPETAVQGVRPLVQALQLAFRQSPNSIDRVFNLATGFTHPRRVTVFRALSEGPRTAAQIKTATGISRPAVNRHLAKLEARGFVAHKAGKFFRVRRRDRVGQALAQLAAR